MSPAAFDEHVDTPNRRVHQPNGSDSGDQTAQAEPEPRFKLIPFADIRLSTARSYLVKGLIPRQGLTVVWGPPKCGKSFCCFDMAMHVALDWEYRGRRVSQGTVVYCAFERADGFTKRVEAFRQTHLSANQDLQVPFYLLPARVNLIADHTDLIDCIIAQAKGETPRLVVLDTLNRSLTGSESKDEDMAAYVKAADAIRERFGCAVVIVHHCGIDGSRPRGHTSLTGAADAQLAVARDIATGFCSVTVEWMKDGPEGDVIGFKLDRVVVGQDQDGDEIDSCIVVPVDSVEAQKPARRVTGAKKIALDLLNRAVAEAGQEAPASAHMPAGVRGVSVGLWRQYCYNGTVAKKDTPDAKRKAFNRALEELQELKLIGVWNDFVWPVV